MTLRLRLSLWYGTLCALTLMAVGLVGYTTSVTEQFLALDRILVVSAQLVESGMRTYGRSYAFETDTSVPTKGGTVMVLRSYAPTGELMYRSPSDPGLPESRPQRPLSAPAPPAYLDLLPLPLTSAHVPPSPNGAFGTMMVDGQRWRRYVVRVDSPRNITIGYVEALTPLGRLDQGARALARLLIQLVVLSVLAVLLIGWWVAGSALRPVDRLTRAARAIAQSRDLGRRVKTGGTRDELGRLAITFNGMLDSLETAWKSQQRFVGDASHELRAPLTVMRGNLELLRRHPHLDPAEREEMLGDIERETSRLSRLVEDLLLLARSDAGVQLACRPVSLRAAALEALRDARLLAPGLNLDLRAEDRPYMVSGDHDRLKQLLLILLDNASKYTPEGSTVTVCLGEEGNDVLLTVKDQGSGIPPEAQAHIFERFYRADPARQREPGGAGLGLSIAQWIAAQLRGSLEVQSTGPDGTTFCLRLPAADLPEE
ncbi:HAMP domain-containing sensor histidine kinase [Deinococcus deserti]|uniref:histidine kinase n=1 Tax=Deinococcus deserti (strain DSM 17065 / CIP 109153 / LMG 22923 / VCD115) TaxID=546414 RepID=C1D2S9_DEIDV|nr:HAMP domain-containing sensor histidine kinase [Deinococcus deserti]ACO47718.1 putative histidine kinase, classic; putative membrane protein [Deinococcus deserti VCD115]